MNTDYTQGSGNVFADLGLPDAQNALVKADLALAIAATIEERGLSQEHAAALIGVDQAGVSRIVRGHLDQCGIDDLLRYLTLLSRDVTITVGPPAERAQGALRVQAV